MAELKNVKFQSYTNYFTAVYVSNDNQEYEIVFCISGNQNLNQSFQELVSVEHEGELIELDTALWKGIEKEIQELLLDELLWTEIEKSLHNNKHDYKYLKFIIKIDRNWLETLEELIAQILVCSPCSPEEALEAGIFRQIKEQLNV